MKEASRYTLNITGLDNIASYIYRLRNKYIEEFGDNPEGVIIPARTFLAMKTAIEHEHSMDIEMGVIKYIFGMKVTPTTSNEISLIPNERDVVYFATEGLKEVNEQVKTKKH